MNETATLRRLRQATRDGLLNFGHVRGKPSIHRSRSQPPTMVFLFYLFRLILAGVFLVASFTKLADLSAFSQAIGQFGIVPDAWLGTAATVIALAELIAGIGLIFGVRGSFLAAATLLIVFIMALAYGIYLGLDIDCGCFGKTWTVPLRLQLILDLGLLALCGGGAGLQPPRKPRIQTNQTITP